MESRYRSDLRADVMTDEEGKVRHILHRGEPWRASQSAPTAAAAEYLRAQAGVLELAETTLGDLDERVVDIEPHDEGTSYRLAEVKQQFDSATVAFAQTYLGVPVWRTGISVTLRPQPSPAGDATDGPSARVIEVTDTTRPAVRTALPSDEHRRRWRELCDMAERRARDPRSMAEMTPSDRLVVDALGLTEQRAKDDGGLVQVARDANRLRVNRGRFFVYRYEPAERQPAVSQLDDGPSIDLERDDAELTLPLPPVPASIRHGDDRLVTEVVFSLPFAGVEELNWRALIDVETDTVLYLRALIAGVKGSVFRLDPITKTGDLTNTAAQPNDVLNPLRDNEELHHLAAPVDGEQELTGTQVRVVDVDQPNIDPPTEPTGSDFLYDARTNDFAAVSAYYHADELFSVIEDLGFSLPTYFDGTEFPVRVDHRACGGAGLVMNAFCRGNATGDGIGLVGYCLSDLTDTDNPLGRAVDLYVHWHEIGGHGILWDHVESPNFGFAHSAGDGLAGIQADPESLLREAELLDRFRYTPFRQLRWMNRDVADGWGWGGASDTGGYNSEQILATSHFRIYRALGGDSTQLDRRQHASRTVTYLILRAVGDLTPETNPSSADDWCERLMTVDAFDWTSEGLTGGAYHKVIRWAFEVQGLFRPAGAATTEPGAPPEVDIYVDDGRAGVYLPYLEDPTDTAEIWNRHFPDDGTTHQPPLAGFPNFLYVRVGNRGTQPATDATVQLYAADPSSGLEWPAAWTAVGPQQAADGPITSGGQTVVGPFSWSPTAAGPTALLASASATGDDSNVDTIGGPIAHWRLIPFDNNLAQRDVEVEDADPCVQLGSLADHLGTLGLHHGLVQSLTAKLRNARRSCERGNTRPACNQIGAFENELEAKTDKPNGISAAHAAVLRAHSDAIKTVLGC
jgi:zinc metalloprotease ZmpB